MSEARWVAFAVEGKPVPWQRARSTGKRRFTDPKHAAYMEHIKTAFLSAYGGGPRPFYTGAVDLNLIVHLGRPDGHWTTKGELSAAGRRAGVMHVGRPDLDNLIKVVGDALEGLAYANDTQIARISAEKFWSNEQGDPGNVTVELYGKVEDE